MMSQKKGFTLLEIIIVIIIVGVLASLALPRLFSTVEYSRSTEALSNISALRKSMERCFIGSNETYVGCALNNIDIDDPSNSPGAQFGYAITGQSATGYRIVATRNSVNGGDGSSTITMTQTNTGVTRAGTTAFAGIR